MLWWQHSARHMAHPLKSHHCRPVASGFEQRANIKMNMSLKPADVGIPILKALGKKATVLPGTLTKFLVYSLRTVPRWGKIRIMKLVMGGMTRHQRI